MIQWVHTPKQREISENWEMRSSLHKLIGRLSKNNSSTFAFESWSKEEVEKNKFPESFVHILNTSDLKNAQDQSEKILKQVGWDLEKD